MFRAFDATNSTEIVSIAPAWNGRQNALRAHCADIHLQCPECHESVRFRAGESVRPHFAHKHKSQCSMGGESPGVVAVRAALYDWLTTKYGDAVEIEKQDQLRSFPKPVDCWVNRARGPLGYVVFDRGIRSGLRDQIMGAVRETQLPTTFVFHIDTLVPAVGDPECIVLNTTHRAFIADSKYSRCYASRGTSCLHFLDPVSQTLTTFRGLGLRHPPQIFRGTRFVTPLAEVLISPKSGEFVHPGEAEALKEWEAQRPARELAVAAAFRATYLIQKPTPFQAHVDPEATCTLCGQVTRDHWWYDSSNKTCRCRECQKAGRY